MQYFIGFLIVAFLCILFPKAVLGPVVIFGLLVLFSVMAGAIKPKTTAQIDYENADEPMFKQNQRDQ